jgi:hypothetical protein
MARSNFIGNDVDRLELSDGDFIIVKRELNLEEERRIMARMAKTVKAGQTLELDLEQFGIVEVLEYVVEWGGPGFQDSNGRLVPFSSATLRNIRPAKFNEITEALDTHKTLQSAFRDAEKNAQDGAINSSAISPSVGS